MLDSFSFDLPVQLRFGCSVMDEIAKRPLPGNRLMVVTAGQTIQKNGTLERLLAMVQKKAEQLLIFNALSPNPTREQVMNGAKQAKGNQINCIIALGGGTAMDAAKGIAAMSVHDGDLWDYTASGSGKGLSWCNPPLPLIAVPTTAGTGSEMNKTAVISDPDRNEKIGFRISFPIRSYVDPELTLSIPPFYTAVQGFDAFCHCLEAYTSVKANPINMPWAAAGIRAIYQWLPEAVRCGSNIEARYHVSYGAMLGGAELYLSSATSAHTIEHMLSAKNPSLSHGAGLAIIFRAFHRVISENVPKPYAEIADILGIGCGLSAAGKAAALLDSLEAWQQEIGLSNLCLNQYGFSSSDLEEMIRMVHVNAGGALTRDRYALTDDDLYQILQDSMESDI